jgi:hypothetical protein
MRVTDKHLEAKVSTINAMLGFDVDALECNTVGSIQLYHAYGASQIHRVANAAHGVSQLSTLGTKRETAEFLSGMIAALRIMTEESESAR